MLDFLNEKDGLELNNEKSAPLPKNNSVQTPQAGQDGFISAQNTNKSARKSTVLLAVLFIAGLLGLFYMIKKGAPQIASATISDPEQAQVEMLAVKLGGVRSEMSNKMEIIVKKFYEFANVKQVALGELIRNPFRLIKSRTTVTDDEVTKTPSTTYKAADFQLFSIMRTGSDTTKWCCMINDKLLYQGETIAGFTITEIGENSVILRSGENKITLKLTDN
jgi:preprotein translocase subunit SecG